MRPYPTADQKYLMTKSSVMLRESVLSERSCSPVRDANFEDGVDVLGQLLVGIPQDSKFAFAAIVKAEMSSVHFNVQELSTYAISSLSRPTRPRPVRYSPSRRASVVAIRPKAGVAFFRTQAVK